MLHFGPIFLPKRNLKTCDDKIIKEGQQGIYEIMKQELEFVLYITDNLSVEEVDGSLGHCGILL